MKTFFKIALTGGLNCVSMSILRAQPERIGSPIDSSRTVLLSPGFCRNFGSGCEPECLHFIGVLSFDDEFREDVA